MAHSPGTQGPTRSKGSRQLTSTCGTPWHMGIGQVQTAASAVARRTRAAAETAVSTTWSVCGRLWRFACAFRTTCRRRSRRRAADRPEARAVASAPEGAACDRTEPRSSRGAWPASAAALGGCAAPCGRGGRGSTGVSARRCSTVPSRTWLNFARSGRVADGGISITRGTRLGRRIWQLGPRDLGSIGRETIRRILGLLADSGAPLCRDDTFAAKCWDGEALAWCAYFQ